MRQRRYHVSYTTTARERVQAVAGRTRGDKSTWSRLDARHIVAPHMNMREAIGARGLTRDGFAAAMGVSAKRLDKWLDGAPGSSQAATCIQNAELVRAAHILGASVWYLLDLTDERDGSGARPMECLETVKDYWGRSKDPEKAAPIVRTHVCENVLNGDLIEHTDGDPWPDGTDATDWANGEPHTYFKTWQLTWQGNRIVAEVRYIDLEDLEEARHTRYHADADERAAARDCKSWETWYRQKCADRLRRDVLELRGDFRDPLQVAQAEMEYASKHPGGAEFDGLLARIDHDARAIMG